jgi:hypothetical protein
LSGLLFVCAANIYNNKSFVHHIRNLRAVLRRAIDIDFGLLDELLSIGVLSDEEIASIRSLTTPELMNDQMLEKLTTVHTKRIGKFMAGLQRTGQLHVFNYIRCDGG